MAKVEKDEVKVTSLEVGMIRDRFLRAMDNMISSRLNLGKVKLKNRREFADLMGMAPSRLHFIEVDGRMPTVEQLYNLCERGGVSPNWLMMGKGTMFGEEEFTSRMKQFEKRIGLLEDQVRALQKPKK